MPAEPTYVIIGASLAGAKAAETLREEGFGGPAAARAMLGQDVSYDWVPYFYSDQYDLGMEAAGLPEPGRYDQVVYRGDRESREFIAFWLSGGAVVAGMNVNVWDVKDDIQALIRAGAAGSTVDTGRLADPGIPITEL